jgi:hypothetical protein
MLSFGGVPQKGLRVEMAERDTSLPHLTILSISLARSITSLRLRPALHGQPCRANPPGCRKYFEWTVRICADLIVAAANDVTFARSDNHGH